MRQVVQNLALEGLVKIGDNGRPDPWLAKGWDFEPHGHSLKVHLRPGVMFQDGSAVTAPTVVGILQRLLPDFMGAAYTDIQSITAAGGGDLSIALKRNAPFALEPLEAQFRSPAPGHAGTGPFAPVGPESPMELRANEQYYLGRPVIDRIVVSTYPTVRAAWAEMLRDHLDMLFDVGTDALDSLERSNSIAVFTYLRHYQYALIFNTQRAALRSPKIRQALSQAVDRDAFVREALNGHGVPSSGPIWPHHWALDSNLDKVRFDPASAAKVLAAQRLHFTCLVPPDYERLALTLKRQLQAVGVTMEVKELPPDEIYGAMSKRDFDAVLFDIISGPSLFRPFLWWHSGAANPAGFSNAFVDAALDQIRGASSDDEYRSGVAAFQQAMLKEPPAIFLAWPERARALNKRFSVPDAESGRDVLGTIRLWTPDPKAASARRTEAVQ